MKTLEEKIEVMQACLDGKTIEIFEDGIWNDWKANRQFPDFNWTDFDYRIKPENKQVPFDFSDAEHLINRKVRLKGKRGLHIINSVDDDSSIMIHGDWVGMGVLAEKYEIWNNTLNRWESCTKIVKG